MRSGKRSRIFLLCILYCIMAFITFCCISRYLYGRSVMATLAEYYMIIIDRDSIYEEGETFKDNLVTMSVKNLETYEIPSSVKMSVSVNSTYEHKMQVFYINKESKSNTVILYLHGGAYLNEPLKYHWNLINTLAEETDCTVVFPLYLKVPNYSAQESYAAMLDFYLDLVSRENVENLIIAGDSSGGGMALSLSMILRDEYPDVIHPQELLLIVPWLDVSMENPDIANYEAIDPMLDRFGTTALGKLWAGKLDVHDPMVSPIYGTFENLGHITVFTGTNDMLCADILKFSAMLSEQGIDHELVIGEGLAHPYPLFPTPEANDAKKLMINIITTAKYEPTY